ncbi:Helicase POLQ-like [Frankliniella fusca]|uniref:Helicase POLQ-like n=1 Tax=Frankliniella fusca TaxID=407009 RepID=A0AAE1HXQ4_9NEOP|nr:Helicase POLQ-like [Frankliniella fusca]
MTNARVSSTVGQNIQMQEAVDRTVVSRDNDMETATAVAYLNLCGDEKQFVDDAIVGHSFKRVDAGNHLSFLQDCPDVNDDGFYGLGARILAIVYDTFAISDLHDWQKRMLREHIQTSNRKNALVLAPTSGGKTLVAFILILRCLLVEGKDAIMTLPYVAIVAEKVRELRILSSKIGSIAVQEYAGSKGHIPPARPKPSLRTIYFATPEKASSLWKSLCKDGERYKEIGITVMDEFHMIRDRTRGMIFEELVVNTLHCARRETCIIALSATVGNPEEVRRFVGGGVSDNCNVFLVTSRPQKIEEHVIVAGLKIPIVRDEDGQGEVRYTATERQMVLHDGDALADPQLRMLKSTEDRILAKLVFDSMAANAPIIVFCSTRVQCVRYCQMLTEAFIALHGTDSASELIRSQREDVIGHLKDESKGMVQKILLSGIEQGIAFHSAGLHATEKKAVEDAFAKGIILAIACTTTLAAGVNLPASRIVIRSPRFGEDFLSYSSYLQVVGRAGRGCLNSISDGRPPDSYIMIQSADTERFDRLLQQGIEDVTSQLLGEATYYRRTSSHSVSPKQDSRLYTGVTRIIISSLDMTEEVADIQTLISVYRLTLLYQVGVKNTSQQREMRLVTLKPLLEELLNLIRNGYIELFKYDGLITHEVRISREVQMDVADVTIPQVHMKECAALSKEEVSDAIQVLHDALNRDEVIHIPNYGLKLSAATVAATAGCMSLEDAEAFRLQIEKLQRTMRMDDYLTFLYLSITTEMSRDLTEPSPQNPNATDVPTLVAKKLVHNFTSHPDRTLMEQLDLTERKMNLWVMGVGGYKNNAEFVSIVKRLWSAMFVRDLFDEPA